jgi:hypothetical protein
MYPQRENIEVGKVDPVGLYANNAIYCALRHLVVLFQIGDGIRALQSALLGDHLQAVQGRSARRRRHDSQQNGIFR